MKHEPVDISKSTNLVFNEVKRKLEDKKTTVFVFLTGINIFLLGLLLAEYRQSNEVKQRTQDKLDTLTVYVHSLEKQILKIQEQND